MSTNAYDLARKMGCDPVYLRGSLAFSDGQVHARGAALEERLSWKESRTWRREIHNYAQLTAIPPLTVEDLRGGLSQTNGKLAIFYRWFETRFESDARTGLDVVNCARTRGALFQAGPTGELQELAARVGSPELDVGPDTVTHSVLKQVREIRENLASINSAYQEAWRLTEPSRRSDALDVLGEMLRRMPELELLGNTAQKAIQQLGRGDIGESPEQLHPRIAQRLRVASPKSRARGTSNQGSTGAWQLRRKSSNTWPMIMRFPITRPVDEALILAARIAEYANRMQRVCLNSEDLKGHQGFRVTCMGKKCKRAWMPGDVQHVGFFPEQIVGSRIEIEKRRLCTKLSVRLSREYIQAPVARAGDKKPVA